MQFSAFLAAISFTVGVLALPSNESPVPAHVLRAVEAEGECIRYRSPCNPDATERECCYGYLCSRGQGSICYVNCRELVC